MPFFQTRRSLRKESFLFLHLFYTSSTSWTLDFLRIKIHTFLKYCNGCSIMQNENTKCFVHHFIHILTHKTSLGSLASLRNLWFWLAFKVKICGFEHTTLLFNNWPSTGGFRVQVEDTRIYIQWVKLNYKTYRQLMHQGKLRHYICFYYNDIWLLSCEKPATPIWQIFSSYEGLHGHPCVETNSLNS